MKSVSSFSIIDIGYMSSGLLQETPSPLKESPYSLGVQITFLHFNPTALAKIINTYKIKITIHTCYRCK